MKGLIEFNAMWNSSTGINVTNLIRMNYTILNIGGNYVNKYNK